MFFMAPSSSRLRTPPFQGGNDGFESRRSYYLSPHRLTGIGHCPLKAEIWVRVPLGWVMYFSYVRMIWRSEWSAKPFGMVRIHLCTLRPGARAAHRNLTPVISVRIRWPPRLIRSMERTEGFYPSDTGSNPVWDRAIYSYRDGPAIKLQQCNGSTKNYPSHSYNGKDRRLLLSRYRFKTHARIHVTLVVSSWHLRFRIVPERACDAFYIQKTCRLQYRIYHPALWCNGSTSDSDSEDGGSIPLGAA